VIAKTAVGEDRDGRRHKLLQSQQAGVLKIVALL
jgi:hypothetical protein